MATLGDTLLIHLGIDASALKSGLKSAVDNSKNATEEIGNAQEKHIQKSSANIAKIEGQATKSLNTVLGLAKRLAGPVTAALSFGAIIKSYWGGMGQVAQMTGAYYKQLDEWREKMAALHRYTKEDLELYRRVNRSMTDFRIAMADLSAEIMRSFSPLFKVALEALEKFTKFISEHRDDVVRFLKVIAGIIMTALIPAFVKLAAAMLMNPITWVIGLLLALALAIDDLIVYLQGGESSFGAFWKPCVELAKQAFEWVKSFWNVLSNSEAFTTAKESVMALWGVFQETFSNLLDLIKLVWDGLKNLFAIADGNGVFQTLGQLATATFGIIIDGLGLLFSIFNVILSGIVALFTGDFSKVERAWNSFCDRYKHLWDNVVNALRAGVDLIKGIVMSVGEAIMGLGHRIADALDLSGIIAGAKRGIANLIDAVPDFLKTDGMKSWIEEQKQNGNERKSQASSNQKQLGDNLPPTEGYTPHRQLADNKASPFFNATDLQKSLSSHAPTAASLVNAQNNKNITNNTTRNNLRTVNNNVTINSATPEMTERAIETLNNIDDGNTVSVGNSTMAVS